MMHNAFDPKGHRIWMEMRARAANATLPNGGWTPWRALLQVSAAGRIPLVSWSGVGRRERSDWVLTPGQY